LRNHQEMEDGWGKLKMEEGRMKIIEWSKLKIAY
jgi:hypothetical protein